MDSSGIIPKMVYFCKSRIFRVFCIMTARLIKIRWFVLIFGLIFCLCETLCAEDWFALLDSNSCQRRNRAWNALSLEAQETQNPADFLRSVQTELQKSSLSFEAQERLEVLERKLEKRLHSESQALEEEITITPSGEIAVSPPVLENPSVWEMLTSESPVKRNLAEREIRAQIRGGQKLPEMMNRLREIIVQDSVAADDRLRVWKLETLARQKWLENADFTSEIPATRLKESVNFLAAANLPEDRLVPWMSLDERTRSLFSIAMYQDPFGGDGFPFLDFEDYKTGKREGLKIWKTVQLVEEALICEKTRPETLKLIQERLASETVTPAGTILLKRLEFLTVPCMAAEYWIRGAFYRSQILQIGVPHQSGTGISFFDSSTDETAHCQQGTNLATRDYPWGVAIKHPHHREAFFYLLPLKTVESKLLYASRILEDPEQRLRLLSEKTLQNLPETEEEKQDLVVLLSLLDAHLASRKAGEWLFVPEMKPFEAEICEFLQKKGTKEAVPDLLRRLEGEPILKANRRVDWFAALGIAERDPWDGVDDWLKKSAERDLPLEEQDPAESSSPMLLTAPGGKPANEAKADAPEKNVPTLASEAKKILQKREESESDAKNDGGMKLNP